jgi:uncharacterized protein YjiS (DUF1127 family)
MGNNQHKDPHLLTKPLKELTTREICSLVKLMAKTRMSSYTTKHTLSTLNRYKVNGYKMRRMNEQKLEDIGIKHPEAKRILLELVWRDSSRMKRLSSKSTFHVVLLNNN